LKAENRKLKEQIQPSALGAFFRMDSGALVREKLNEYLMMLAPLDRAEQDISFARRMLRARTEEELHHIAPALGALSDALRVSTLDLLLAPDRVAFVEEAVARSGLTVDEIRRRLVETGPTAREDLKMLGIGEPL
jgi:hypothetical protein